MSLTIPDIMWIEIKSKVFYWSARRARFNTSEVRFLMFSLVYFFTTRDIKPFIGCVSRIVRLSPFWSHRRLFKFLWFLVTKCVYSAPSVS